MSKTNFKTSPNKGAGQGCLVLFGMPFFAAGCFILWSLVAQPLIQNYESSAWVKTPCVIFKSELQVNRGSDGNTYRPIIHYSYNFEGKPYKSDRVDFAGEISSGDRFGESAHLKKYPLKTTRDCFVDPNNPKEAVLIRDWGRGLFKWVAIPFGGVFACVGFGIMLFGASPWLFKRKEKHNKLGEVVLKPTAQRLGELGGMLFINIFWNGIVSVFVIFWLGGLFRGTAKGAMETWGLGLFLTPFIFIGGFLIWKLIKQIHKLKAPKISITLKDGLEWKCGTTVPLQWDIPFSAEVESVRLDFVCCESATYRRGSSRSTDKKVVAIIPIVEQHSHNYQERCKFIVPEGLMPSFESNNNRVEWSIRVRSQGPGPDADDLYTINLQQGQI